MKNLIIFSLFAIVFLAACNEKDIIDNAQQVGHSKITYYPIITVKGPAYATVAKGTTFTDPGVSALAGSTNVPVTTSGTVNTNVVGVYSVTYTATNTDGFSATASRKVVVYSTDASAAAHDLSGNYARTSNGSVATWTKLAPGVYQLVNVGGAPTLILGVIAFNPTGFIINIPPQPDSNGGTTSCTNATGGTDITYNAGPPASYALVVINPSFGTGLRTFVKQ